MRDMVKSRLTICRWSLGRKAQSEMTDCAEKGKYLDMSIKRKMHSKNRYKIIYDTYVD